MVICGVLHFVKLPEGWHSKNIGLRTFGSRNCCQARITPSAGVHSSRLTQPQEHSARSPTTAIIGLGYVGLPLCLAFHSAGHQVIGLDVDCAKITALRAGDCYLKHLGQTAVAAMTRSDRFEATTDASRLVDADAVLICVPTPLDEKHEPDLTYVKTTTDMIARSLPRRGRDKPPQLVVLESTTYPGTTRDVVAPILRKAGVPFLLGFSPERVDPGRPDPIQRIPKLVSGMDNTALAATVALYSGVFDQVIPVRSCEVAEAAKLLENIYRAVNIALVNELKVVLDVMGIDIWEVVEAAATKPYGFQRFDPGPGLGGHCIPIDPFYLSWKAKQEGAEARFIELAGRVNREMPARVVGITLNALKERGVTPGNARILVLGLAYKPDIDDVRESPSFELIDLFVQAGCNVDYADPHVPRTHFMRHFGDLNMESVSLSPQNIAAYDAIVVSTAHRVFPWDLIARCARLIIDTRNAMAFFPGAPVIKA